MKIAMRPIRLAVGDNQTNLRALAQAVSELHDQAGLIVFPQIPLAEAPASSPENTATDFLTVLDRQVDIVAAMALKKRVAIAVCFIEAYGHAPAGELVMASATGQVCTRKFAMPPSGIIEKPIYLSARVLGVPLVFGVGDLMEVKRDLKERIEYDGVKTICMPLCFAGNDEEIGRIAAHNPPASLQALKNDLACIARENGANLLAVNSIGEDSNTRCGPCGGIFRFDERGELAEEKHLYYEGSLYFDAPEPPEG